MVSPTSKLNRAEIPALGPERPVVWPRQFRRKLSNGLEVALVESHTIPKFTAELFFAVAIRWRPLLDLLKWPLRLRVPVPRIVPAAGLKKICVVGARIYPRAPAPIRAWSHLAD